MVPVSVIGSTSSRVIIPPMLKLDIDPLAGVVDPQFAMEIVLAPALYPAVQSQTFPSYVGGPDALVATHIRAPPQPPLKSKMV
jgi:hypothetical protein